MRLVFLVLFCTFPISFSSFAQDTSEIASEKQAELTLETPTAPPPENPNTETTQAQDTAAAEAPKSGRVEKLEVTGSHIKRIDVEGPSPVLTLDNEDLVRSGYNSVSDVLRDTGVNAFGSFREHAGVVGGGTSAVDLRGLGQVRTLVLLNGQRLPASAVAGAVDLNIIPIAAVERIDILKDGASATYGSDALGGVVNIITKKDFSGHEIGMNTSLNEHKGGERHDLSYTYGYNSNKFRMVNVLFFRHNERILAKDREWSKRGLSSIGNPGSYSLNNGTTYKEDPKCPPDMVINGRCYYDFGPDNWEVPYVQQGALLNEMNYDISESLTAFTRIVYSHKQTDWVTSPSFSDTQGNTLTMTAPSQLGADAGSTITNVRYRFNELGNRRSHTTDNMGSALVGLKGYLSDTWDWESSLSFSKIDSRETRKGYALTADIQNALTSGQFNPYADAGQKGDISGLLYDPSQRSTSENTFFDWKATGEIGEFGAGPVALAVGTQALRELYSDIPDARTANGEVMGMASSSGGGARNSYSFFSEIGFQFFENLETLGAVRFDHYEGFGGTFNPKLSVRYKPWEELMFRASAGTGFKAPQMQRLYAAQTTGYQNFVDRVYCAQSGDCAARQYSIRQRGNANLKEETSFSGNAGVVFQPVKNHSVGVDFWYYQLKDLVEDIDYGAITRAQLAGADLGALGVIADRNPSTGELNFLSAQFLNTASLETQGIDVSYNGKLPTKIGEFQLRADHSHTIYYKTEAFPGLGVTDRVGIYGRPQWRNNATLFYSPNKTNEYSILARTIAQNAKTNPAAGRHPTYTEFDFRYSFSIESWSAKVIVGVRNILGTTPPYDDSNPLDPDINFRLYDERMRSVYLGYRQDF